MHFNDVEEALTDKELSLEYKKAIEEIWLGLDEKYPPFLIKKCRDMCRQEGMEGVLEGVNLKTRLESFLETFDLKTLELAADSLSIKDKEVLADFYHLIFFEYDTYRGEISVYKNDCCPPHKQKKNIEQLQKKIEELILIYNANFTSGVNYWNLKDGLTELVVNKPDNASTKAVTEIFDFDRDAGREFKHKIQSLLEGLQQVCELAIDKPYLPKYDIRKVAIQRWVDLILEFLSSRLSLTCSLPQYTNGIYHSASPAFEVLVLLSKRLPLPPTERTLFEAMSYNKRFKPCDSKFKRTPYEAVQNDSRFFVNQNMRLFADKITK